MFQAELVQKYTSEKAFSLIELLVSLSVLALVAAIILPRFMNVQDQANDVVARATADELNHVYGAWKASGGTITGSAPTIAGLLTELCSTTAIGSSSPIVSGDSNIYDTGNSGNVRFTPPSDLLVPLPNDTSSAIGFNNIFISYDTNKQSFTGISQKSAISSGNPPATYSQNGITYTWNGTNYTTGVIVKGKPMVSP